MFQFNPFTGKLDIVSKENILDGTAQGQLAFWDATLGKWTYTETSELFWDDTNKRVGIGTDSPTGKVHIVGDYTDGEVLLKFGLDGGRDWTFQQEGTGASTGLKLKSLSNKPFYLETAEWYMSKPSYQSYGFIFRPGDNTRRGGQLVATSSSNFYFDMSNSGTGDYIFTADKISVGSANPTNKLDVAGACVIGASYIGTVAPTNGLLVEGNVGIGTASPASTLDIRGPVGELSIDDTTTQNAKIRFRDAGVTKGSIQSDNSANMRFKVNGGDEAVRILANGNVGIGTTSPKAKLNLPAGTATAGTAPLKFTTGTALTTPETGTIEFHDDRFYITNVGCRRPISRANDVITETTTIENTTTETTVYTATVPADSLKAGNYLCLQVCGELTNASASDDITLRVKIGSTTVETFNPAIGNVTDANWCIKTCFTVRSVGATGKLAFHAETCIDDDDECVNTEEVTVDTTSAENITITVEWDNAKAGNIFKAFQGITEWKN